jgi:NAD(P)H-hydrate epimerase
MIALSRAEARAVDRHAIEQLGIPGVVLMENAGRGAAELLLSLGGSGRIVICCGKGNNGGDGLVIARHLHLAGREVRILLYADPDELQGDARINLEIVRKLDLPMLISKGSELDEAGLRHELVGAVWIVDALFGTGLTGPVRPPLDRVIELINASLARVLAVDIPSGLDCDTGQPPGPTIRAEHTATFFAWKRGFLMPGAAAWTGRVHVLGIGAPGWDS